MIQIYSELAERIRGEVSDLDGIVNRVVRHWAQVQQHAIDGDAYLDSVALNLHGFYSGLERVFELIARHVDQDLPSGLTWHQNLLQIVGSEKQGVRPAVISPEHVDSLDEYRRFRHLVRNVYTTHLQPDRIAGLVNALPNLWDGLRAELLAFANFLELVAGL
jgi:hypothetical protein